MQNVVRRRGVVLPLVLVVTVFGACDGDDGSDASVDADQSQDAEGGVDADEDEAADAESWPDADEDGAADAESWPDADVAGAADADGDPGQDADSSPCPPCHEDASCVEEACACDPGFEGDGVSACDPLWEVERLEGVDLGAFYYVAGHGGRIYFARGGEGEGTFFRSVDVATGAVRDESPMPAASQDFCGCGLTARLVATDSGLIALGNYEQRYDVTAQVWSSLSYPPIRARGDAGLAVHGGGLIVVGGRSLAASVTDSASRNDLSSNQWRDLPDYPVAVQGPAAAVVNDYLFVTGGHLESFDANRTLTVLAPDTRSWIPRAEAPFTSSWRSFGAGYDGRLWVLNDQERELWFYDMTDDLWATEPVSLPPGYFQLVVLDDGLYVAGDDGGDFVYARYIGS